MNGLSCRLPNSFYEWRDHYKLVLNRTKAIDSALEEAEAESERAGSTGLQRTLGAFDLIAIGVGVIISQHIIQSIPNSIPLHLLSPPSLSHFLLVFFFPHFTFSFFLLAVFQSTIGAGIFVLTGVAAAKAAGPGIIFSYVFAGFACVCAALCYSEFASRYPHLSPPFFLFFSASNFSLSLFVHFPADHLLLSSPNSVPIAGSAYTYAYTTVGEFMAWTIGWNLVVCVGCCEECLFSSKSQSRYNNRS
eukprot:TRINITY_DN10257_c0_g1_i1.p2 TRINITY_DN10257_c0_g1~~TRINITY_DN10257_c0_g1_i1.p2  ORF type:complete len:247 (+),score=1.83 TRINITY_DN10257_c0_g1_i1:53-793(+)